MPKPEGVTEVSEDRTLLSNDKAVNEREKKGLGVS